MLERILRSFLWGKQGAAKGIPLVAWDLYNSPRDQGGLGLPKVRVQGAGLGSKWVVCKVKRDAPWQFLVRRRIQQAQHNQRIKGPFQLCEIISNAQAFVI